MSPVTISEAQLTANRENAQLSTGPKTEQGKTRVRLNGLSHGLTGGTVLMPYEDRAAYEAFLATIAEALRPEGPAEHDLAHSIADGRWRLNRVRAIENNMFALGALTSPTQFDEDERNNDAYTQAQTFLQNAQQFQLLTLYEGRIQRAVRKDEQALRELQSARKAAHEKELEQAALLAQVEESKGATYDPATDGFGFSKAFLHRHIDFQKRLAAANAHVNRPLKRAA